MSGVTTGTSTSLTKDALLLEAREQLYGRPALVEQITRQAEWSRTTFVSTVPSAASTPIRTARDAPRRQVATQTEYDPEEYPFLWLPSEDTMKDCLSDYVNHTGNDALQKLSCAACGTLDFSRNFSPRPFNLADIPHRQHLIPGDADEYTHYDLTDGLLLCKQDVRVLPDGTSECTICTDCHAALSRDRRPTFAISRGFWVGDIPDVLRQLTIAERILIQQVFPRVYLVKCRPRKKTSNGAPLGLPDDLLMDGIHGSVCSVKMPTTDAVRMLEGELANKPVLPNPSWVLASTLSVAFLGFGSVPTYYLRGMFTVRRKMLLDALLIFKQINPLYRNVTIDYDALAKLPEECVPDSIVVRDADDPRLNAMAEAEGTGYVRTDDDDGCEAGAGDDAGSGDDADVEDDSHCVPITAPSPSLPGVYPYLLLYLR